MLPYISATECSSKPDIYKKVTMKRKKLMRYLNKNSSVGINSIEQYRKKKAISFNNQHNILEGLIYRQGINKLKETYELPKNIILQIIAQFRSLQVYQKDKKDDQFYNSCTSYIKYSYSFAYNKEV